jgi:hypothetical protein
VSSKARPATIRLAVAAAAVAVTLPLIVAAKAVASPRPRYLRTTTSAPVFATPTVVDPVHSVGEPDIRVAPSGNTYDSGPWGTGTQRSIWNQSTDGGHTFHPVHSPAVSTAFQSDSNVPCPQGVSNCPGGGDTEIAIDHTGKVYYQDLAALASLKSATWDPSTKTMQTGFIANPPQNADGIDRQWFALWDPPTRPAGYTGPLPVNYDVYLNALTNGSCGGPLNTCESATYSTDGVNYSAQTVEYQIGLDGNAAIDQTTGTVLQAIGYSTESDAGVAILTRDPTKPSDPSLVNVQTVKIADLPAGDTMRGLFPVLAMDKNRTAYEVWVTVSGGSSGTDPTAWQIYYSYATAASGWQTWSTPVQVSQAPSNTNIMPWVTAGTKGRIGVVWYGTTDSSHNPSSDDAHQPWDVYLATITGADTAVPAIQQARITAHPMHYGTICLDGTGCILELGNRNLADFFQDSVDPRNGAIVITYDDTSNELTQEHINPPVDGTADHRGAPVVMEVRQVGGTTLFGKTLTGTPSNALPEKDNASNDATFDPLYSTTNIPALDLQQVSVKGSGSNVVFSLRVGNLRDFTTAFTTTGAAAIDFVIRWTGPAIDDPTDGIRNPIEYAAAEVLAPKKFSFSAGDAISVELCSVSGCFPHIVDYPAPPRGGTAVTGKIVHQATGDVLQITVPRSSLHGLTDGSLLESFSAYALVRDASASATPTNADAQAGITPIEVDGICCEDVTLSS